MGKLLGVEGTSTTTDDHQVVPMLANNLPGKLYGLRGISPDPFVTTYEYKVLTWRIGFVST